MDEKAKNCPTLNKTNKEIYLVYESLGECIADLVHQKESFYFFILMLNSFLP